MKKLFLLFLIFCLPVICRPQAGVSRAIEDTLIEPGKKNPPGEINPDTTKPLPPPPPETAGTDTTSAIGTPDNENDYAVAELSPTKGFNGEGRLTFTKIENGVKIGGEISGLSPGLHGIHIHEYGKCDDSAAQTAGGHFNPDQMPHGSPEDVHRHTGDLGNITADENGIAKIDITDTKISFEGPNSIIGRSVIVHEKVDDLKSQPAGNSGKRILCGVIKLVKK